VNTPGFYSGYKKLLPAEKEKVIFAKAGTEICKLPAQENVYAVNAALLSECLSQNDTSVIYIWSPDCHSEVCISVSAARYYCNKNNYKLYVVAEYYDLAKMTAQNAGEGVVYTIDHKYYRTDYCNAYQKRFVTELNKGTRLGKEDKFHRFLFFKKDKFIFTRSRLAAK
jgi:hypothetical protein